MSGHNHHHHHHHHASGGSKNILIAFILNASFAVIELIGGYFTNSVAIYSDALHDFGDSLALLFSYFAEKISQKESDRKYTFGYRRFSMLSAIINGVILIGGSIFVIYEAVSRLYDPQELKPEGMIGLAVLGIAVNAIAAFRLSKDDGMNAKMVMYHLLEDLFGWVAVLAVSIILLFKPWYFLDSVLSILISLVILKGVIGNFKKVSVIFLQKFPESLDRDKIKSDLLRELAISDVHAFKGWSVDDSNFYLRFHVQVPGDTTVAEIDVMRKKIKNYLKELGVKFSTVEFEPEEGESQACEDEQHD